MSESPQTCKLEESHLVDDIIGLEADKGNMEIWYAGFFSS